MEGAMLMASKETTALRMEPNEDTYAAIAAAGKGEDLYAPFEPVEELMEALNA